MSDCLLNWDKQTVELSFNEDGIDSSFSFNQGDIPGFNEIGDSGSYASFVYDDSDNRIGSSESSFEVVQALEDGTFLADAVQSFNFGNGNTITIEGQLNVQDFEALEVARLPIVEGSGIYDNARGYGLLQQQELGVFDVIGVELQIVV